MFEGVRLQDALLIHNFVISHLNYEQIKTFLEC